MRYSLILLFIGLAIKLSAQVTAEFNVPIDPCKGEKFDLTNNSINASRFEWDFCIDEFSNTPSENYIIDINGANNVRGNDLYYDSLNRNFYFFNTNDNGNLYRTNLGKNLDGPYVTNQLSILSGSLQTPQTIKIIRDKSNNNYYGYIGSRTNGFGISRINFGNDIENNNVNIENLGTFGEGNVQIRDLKVYEENNEYFLLGLNLNARRFFLIKYGESLANIPYDTVTSNMIPNINNANGFELVKKDDEIIGFVVGLTSQNIVRINFGSSIETGFVFEEEYTNADFPSELNRLSRIEIQEYFGNYYAIVNQFDSGNPTLTLDLKNLSLDSTVVDLGYSNSFFPVVSGGYFYGRYQYFGVNNEKLYSLIYDSECGEIKKISSEFEPINSYTLSGTYSIALTAFDSNGNSSSITKEITVTNNQAPNITYTTGDNLCISNPIQFTSQSTANISSYNWDFGDGNTSTAENPAYNYSTPGDYEVRLNVTDANGCNNLFVDTVSVYAEPVADFQATAQGSICSQKPIVFENLTSLPTTATFEWDLGDGTTSTEENPVHEYAAAGDYTITQIINMAGCVVERTKTITVNPGPLVSFETNNNCLGELIQFANTSEGEFLDNYTWDLGDGTQTTQANPSHQYDTAGVYQVQLTAFTTNGCDFTITQEVEISPLANVAFEADVACANQATQFTQLVTVDQSNITDYLWDFGVAGVQTDISSEADPEFIFPEAGTYEVGLQVTTSDGCTSFSSQSITVNEVPNAEFDAENNCIGQLRKFTPQDTINSISHFWELRDNVGSIVQTSQETVFEYQFDVEGTYELTYRQENENLCSSTNSQIIEIYEEPLPDFSWDKACVGTAIQIENLSDLKGNSLKSYNWSIDGEIRSNALNPEFIFEDTGSYEINLILETQSGCSQNISKIIDIKPSPESFFQLNQKVGAYPFDIATTADNADIISSVLWTLDGDSISSDQELTYTINEVGTYLLGLRLVNAEGCVDEYFEQIKVREPSLDVALNNLTVNEDDEFTSFIFNIRNRGSLVPERIDLRIDLGSYEVTETVNAPIYPEDNRNYSLSLKLTEEQRKGLKKICIEASAKSSIIDEDNLVNNKVCTNLESGFQVLEIYPNPAISQITIPIITPESDVLSFRLEDSNGKNINNFNYSLEAGYNEISFQRDNISSGVYFLRFRFQGEEVIKKLIFQ
ncbi:PKD domain-containing protein [Marivirga arenosa]|uniref:PKD domain-containing protein n=1 Tax=Marivirga arenosa TaxID=3059076 RepID=A0AA51N844_9BACT|nr:PKD domain-containing protein [Marivirga sp. ABR2-2]WMN07694.1 PKD domain-containing protein [Marivirga sp. ABR2-2]